MEYLVIGIFLALAVAILTRHVLTSIGRGKCASCQPYCKSQRLISQIRGSMRSSEKAR